MSVSTLKLSLPFRLYFSNKAIHRNRLLIFINYIFFLVQYNLREAFQQNSGINSRRLSKIGSLHLIRFYNKVNNFIRNDSFSLLTSCCDFMTVSGDTVPRQCQEMSRLLFTQHASLLQTQGVLNAGRTSDDGGGRLQNWLAGDRLSGVGGEGG